MPFPGLPIAIETRQEMAETQDREVEESMEILRSIRGQYAGNGRIPPAVVSQYERCRATIERASGADLSHLAASRLKNPTTGSTFVTALYPAIDEILIRSRPRPDSVSDDRLFNPTMISDEGLRSRCKDLLEAEDHFDRAITQATLILEDRLRKITGSADELIGTSLVNRVISGDSAKSMIVFSAVPAEQQGFADLMRGLVGVYRNPFHHRLIAGVSRAQAYVACLWVDEMLRLLGSCKVAPAA